MFYWEELTIFKVIKSVEFKFLLKVQQERYIIMQVRSIRYDIAYLFQYIYIYVFFPFYLMRDVLPFIFTFYSVVYRPISLTHKSIGPCYI